MVRSGSTAATARCGSSRRRRSPRKRPSRPPLRRHPRSDAAHIAVVEGLAVVADREPVDAGQIGIVLDRDDAAEQRDLRVPAVLAEDCQSDGRVPAHVAEAEAARVHVQEDTPLVPVVPGGGRVRCAARAYRRDDRRVRPREERVDLGRYGHGRQGRRAYCAVTATASVPSSNSTSRTAGRRITNRVLTTIHAAAITRYVLRPIAAAIGPESE